jgi:hypothetical protein
MALALAACAPGLAGTGDPLAPAEPQPRVLVRSFQAEIATSDGLASALAWRAPELARLRPVRDAAIPIEVERGATRYLGGVPDAPGAVERRVFPARPDGYSLLDRLTEPVAALAARARGGERVLRSGRLGGRPALRASIPVAANDCAGLAAGTRDVWLDRATLLPLRTVERRRGRVRVTSVSPHGLNAALPPGTFTPPPTGRDPFRSDAGFRRVSPLDAAASLSYRPLVPARLPAGYRLSVSGWAPRGGVTGPEGSNPPLRELFAAVYRRGVERIDLTQRLAGATGFPSDPFGVECGDQREVRATVNGAPATYGFGPDVTPHLVWRRGPLVLTLSGPYPRAALVAIAESLRPVPNAVTARQLAAATRAPAVRAAGVTLDGIEVAIAACV